MKLSSTNIMVQHSGGPSLRDLRQQCLQTNSPAFDADNRVQTWLFLLQVDQRTPQTKSALPPTVPLDKDGWQVANLINNEDQDDWKVVRSKRSKHALRTSPAPLAKEDEDSERSRLPSSSSSSSNGSQGVAKSVVKKKKKKSKQRQNEQHVPHKDAEQVDKDIQRSFIGPAFRGMFAADTDKQRRRQQLSDLVLTTLTGHPALSYFQGYHDILTVLLLTFDPVAESPDWHLLQQATQRLSLHVIRDSMTADLQPVMGQLKVLRNLLRVCDAQMAELAERASALPFFALPWLLTLFTHDVDDIAVSQCILDFVLVYGPASAIYLCAAVILAKKESLVSQDPDELDDPAMLHCLLAKLPPISLRSAEAQVSAKEVQQKEKDVVDAVYTDPDVELPSLASDRAIADSFSELVLDTPSEPEHPDSLKLASLLSTAAELMDRFPLTSDLIQADRIMGPHSVLTTWPALFTPTPPANSTDEGRGAEINWKQQDDFAASVLRGPSSAIVVDPHPDLPVTDEESEKAGAHDHRPKRKAAAGVVAHPSAMLAVVSISGLLVAALYAQSGSLTAAGGLARFSPTHASTSFTPTADAKQVLTLIVSLLSQWGRVVGGTT